MNFYDVHTHGKASPTDIKNVIFSWDDPVSRGYYSVGAHPLFYEWTKDLYPHLEKMCRPKSALAVGECGFDKRSPMSFSEQSDLFLTHVRIAEELGKPLMIHCVGHFNELSVVRREVAPTQPGSCMDTGKIPSWPSRWFNRAFTSPWARKGYGAKDFWRSFRSIGCSSRPTKIPN